MGYDNLKISGQHNRAGFICAVDQFDLDKSEFGIAFVLARSAVPVQLTGTLAETQMAAVSVPGGLLGPNGWVRVSSWWSATNNANAKQVKASFAGTQFFSASNGNWQAYGMQSVIANRGNEAVQVSPPVNVNLTQAVMAQPMRTYAIDTAADQVLELRGMLANVADVLTLEAWLVEVFPT